MAYTPQTLKAWIAENPNYSQYPGTVAGKPLIYQVAPIGAPVMEDSKWFVFDWITEFPDLTQSPATADITSTGKTARQLIEIVPDAPSPSAITINLGVDTDAAIDAIEGLVAEYQEGLAGGKRLYLGNYMGEDKKSEVYEGSVSWISGFAGAFPDPITTDISITPNLGGYHKFEKITASVGG